jgi:hypothetical protein
MLSLRRMGERRQGQRARGALIGLHSKRHQNWQLHVCQQVAGHSTH